MKKVYIGKHCRGRNIMLKFKNIENRKNITYKLACNEGKLTSKDKKILNLAKKIEKDASIVKELKKLDKIEEILMVEIVRKCEGSKNFSKETAMEESRACDMQEDIGEAVDDYRNNFDFKEQKVNKVTETGTQSYEDINKNNKDFHLTFENKERAETEVLLPKEKMVPTRRLIKVDWSLLNEEDIDNLNPTTTEHTKEKAMSTRRLIKVDRSLLDNEDNENFHLTFENSKKAQNSSIKTAVQERDIFGSFPFQQSFNGDSAGKEKTPSTKAMQQKQITLVGSAGVMLLVGSVASYIMKMHVIAVIGGIVGLACTGFALYNSFKPNTKLEKLEGVEQSIIDRPTEPNIKRYT